MSEQAKNLTVDDSKTEATETAETLDLLEIELEVYPLRDPSEDPRWALRTMWVWICIAVFLLASFILLFILGIWYD